MGASSGWADQTVFYTLTPAKGTNNSYTGNCDVTIDGITWNITGNSQMQPWRIGGKSITNVDRSVYSKTAMGSAITKVDLTVGAASSITVNSLKLIVASDADFNNKLDEVSATFAANSTITFSPTSGSEWATGAYYKFTFNVTVSVSSNKFVEFTKAEFYAEGGDTPTQTVAAPTFSPAAGEVDYGTSVSITQASAYMINYTVDGSDPTWENGKDIDTNPITITSDVTIKARAYDRDQNASEIVTAAYTVKRPDAPTFSPAAGAVEQGTTVTISGRPTNGKLMYTTDGSDPDYDNNVGSLFVDGDVITINGATTLKAIAIDRNEFSSAVATAEYTIYDPNAKGTINNPYTVEEVIDGTASGNGIYVKGYIVGEYVSNSNPKTTDFGNSNFALADEFYASPEASDVIPVQLTDASGLRTDWGLQGNPGKVSYEVILKGNVEKYFTVNGIKSTSEVDATGVYVKIASSGKSSYYAADAIELVDGVKAYAVTNVTSTSATMKELAGSVPANTGVMLVAAGGASYTLPVIAESSTNVSGNLLVGTANGTTVSEEDGTTYLALSGGEFVVMNPGTIKPHKAYLPVDSSVLGNNSKLALSFEEGEATAISEVNTGKEDGMFYNLNGMRVVAPQKGIYILNGKKIVVK